MLLGGLCLWSILSTRKPAWGWTAQKVTHRTIKHLCPGDQLSMQFALTLSSISTFDNCEAFGAKATIQCTDDSIWWARRIQWLLGSTIPLGVLVQAVVNWKTISRLLTSLRHSKAGLATGPHAWKEPGCFWNVSGVRDCWVLCCQASMSQLLTLCSCRLSSA